MDQELEAEVEAEEKMRSVGALCVSKKSKLHVEPGSNDSGDGDGDDNNNQTSYNTPYPYTPKCRRLPHYYDTSATGNDN